SFTDPSGYSVVGDVLGFAEELDLGKNIKYALFRQMSPELAAVVITVGSVFCGPWAPACAAAGTYDYARANGVPSEQAIRFAGAAAVMSFATSAAGEMAAAGNYGGAAATAYTSGYAAGRLSGGDAALSGRIAVMQLGLKVGMDKYVQSHNPNTPEYSSTLDPAQDGAVVKAEGVGVQDAQASNTGKSIVAPKQILEAGRLVGRPLSDLNQSDLALLKSYNAQIIEAGGRLTFGWQSEGSGFMRFMGQRVGGVNAFSVFHDVWMQHWGVTGGFLITSSIPIAAYLQYETLGAWSQHYILSTADKQ
ncbi:MAG: hypothetical protein ACRESO_08775, partial [Gammaproteobacteria bacterium]